jgi:hypothetical protein
MNKELIESLDLFKLPPPVPKRTKEQKKAELALQA